MGKIKWVNNVYTYDEMTVGCKNLFMSISYITNYILYYRL